MNPYADFAAALEAVMNTEDVSSWHERAEKILMAIQEEQYLSEFIELLDSFKTNDMSTEVRVARK